MPNTPILNIPQVGPNQNQKEATINTGIAILEGAANDTLAVDLSTADHTLTPDEYTKYFSFRCSGNAVARHLDTPLPAGTLTGKRVFVVENTGAVDVTVRPGGAATGTVTVEAGAAALLKCDGVAISTLSSGAAPASGASFVTLSDTPHSFAGQAHKGLRATAAEDGLEFYTILDTLRHTIIGKPDAAVNINFVITQACKLSTNLAGSQFFFGVLPTATIVFNFNKISGATTTAIGSISVATTGAITPTFAADVAFASGEVLQVVTPTPQDATAADMSLAFSTLSV